jgi:DNA repair protein RadA/Sms
MLLAVHRHAGIACFDQDVFLNAVGGVKITEPAADLAVLLSIIRRCATRRCRGLIVFGEVGLAGEIRRRRAAESGCARRRSSVSRPR